MTRLGPLERRGVDRDLVCAGAQQHLGVRHLAHAAADGERDREPFRDAPHKLHERPALLERRGDVEEHELIRARIGVGATQLHRIADLAEVDEVDALDDAAARDVEARDQTRERHNDSRKRAPAAPLFSGWNWTPVNDPDCATATIPSDVAVAHGVSAAYECAK